MLTSLPVARETIWLVKVSRERRLYAQPITVTAADSRRITAALGGRRMTWPPDSPNLFNSKTEALRSAARHLMESRLNVGRAPRPSRAGESRPWAWCAA